MAVSIGSSKFRVAPVQGEADLAQAMAIREVVFIEEQHVPESIEHDAEDARAFHVLAFDGGHAVGTGRLVERTKTPSEHSGRWGQIGRMAVLSSYRGKGVGRAILEALEVEARRRALDGIVLNAQVHAHVFYVNAGYADVGPIFEEAGMPHVEMRKDLSAVGVSSGGKPRKGSGKRRAHRAARSVQRKAPDTAASPVLRAGRRS